MNFIIGTFLILIPPLVIFILMVFFLKEIKLTSKKIYYRVCYQENKESVPRSFSPIGRVFHSPCGIWTGPSRFGYGPYTVFNTLNAAKTFRQTKCHREKIKFFPIYEVLIIPSKEKKVWIPLTTNSSAKAVIWFSSIEELDGKWPVKSCSVKDLPSGTILADDIMLLYKIPEEDI